MTLVKVCGLTRVDDIAAVVEAGADRIGLVLVPSSPRALSVEKAALLAEVASRLGAETWLVAGWNARSGPCIAGLEALAASPHVAAVQLHARERPEDIASFQRACPTVRTVKALGVGVSADLAQLDLFPAVDAFLFDAKPPPASTPVALPFGHIRPGSPEGAVREGGHGRAFDWSLLEGLSAARPWVLSGGLNANNVAEAIQISGATAVDVSSGVESAPGVKDPAKVAAFVSAAKLARRHPARPS